MMNKKGMVVIFPIVILMIGLIFLMIFTAINISNFPKEAEEKCKKLDMELFDYSIGNLFIESSITCWDPLTKEIKKIK